MRDGELEALIKGAVGVLSETDGADRLPAALIHFRQDRQPDVSISTRLIATTCAVGAHHKTARTAHASSWWRCRTWSRSAAGSTIHSGHLYISNCSRDGKRRRRRQNLINCIATLRRVPLQFSLIKNWDAGEEREGSYFWNIPTTRNY